MNDVRTTTDGQPPAPGLENAPAPQPIGPSGQHGAYWVLTDAERAKGFVRPVRHAYVHTGIRPKYELRDLTNEEKERYAQYSYVKYEAYPELREDRSSVVGRFWTQAQLDSGCSTETRMGLAIAETYARDPKFYGSTFCVACRSHFPVAEFIWAGTDEVVGS